LNSFFGNIDFSNKNFLDIGGGIGLHSFYAASKGARQVICLEPEADSTEGQVTTKFNSINKVLNYQCSIKEFNISSLHFSGSI
jgi:FkbM family methyltransferase